MTPTHALLDTLVRTHEAPFATPWRLQMPEAERRQQMPGIGTWASRSTRLEEPRTLRQLRALADQPQVAEILQQRPDAVSRDVVRLMQPRHEARKT
jgi:predicted FMN-binding regulatory protein PaiB